MAVRLSVGITLEVAAVEPASYTVAGFAVLSYTPVGEVTGLGEFGGTASMVNHVPLSNGIVTKRKGSRDYGALSVQIGNELADAGQLLLKDGFDGAQAYAVHSFKITASDHTLYFTGMVASFTQVRNDANVVNGINCAVELDGSVLEDIGGVPANAILDPTSLLPILDPFDSSIIVEP